MYIETRIPSMQRGQVLYSYGGIELVGPRELTILVRRWAPETFTPFRGIVGEPDPDLLHDDVAIDLGLAENMEVEARFAMNWTYDEAGPEWRSDDAAGRYFAEEVAVRSHELHDHPVTSTRMSRISLPKILRLGVAKIAGEYSIRMVDETRGELVTRSFREPAELGVAGAWAYGRLLGEEPTRYIAEVFGISRSAAAQRVARARNRDRLLPPTAQGAH